MCHNCTVAVIIRMFGVKEIIPEINVIECVSSISANKIRKVYKETAERNSDKQKRFKLFLDTEIEKNTRYNYHDEVFPAAVYEEAVKT